MWRRFGPNKRASAASNTASLWPYRDALPIPDKIDMTSAKGGSDPDLSMGVHKIKWVRTHTH